MPQRRPGGLRGAATGILSAWDARNADPSALEAAITALQAAFAATQGRSVIAEYSDIASGKDDRRPGFQAALTRCRQLGVVLVAARLDRNTRRAHTLSQLLEDGVSIRAADMPGADDLMMRVYAAMAQEEREADRRADQGHSGRLNGSLARLAAKRNALGPDEGDVLRAEEPDHRAHVALLVLMRRRRGARPVEAGARGSDDDPLAARETLGTGLPSSGSLAPRWRCGRSTPSAVRERRNCTWAPR